MTDHNFTGPPDWSDIRFFLTLAREKSLSAAARALGVTHATVARRIAQLEAATGSTLFERLPNGYMLTPAGQDVLAIAETMAEHAGRFGETLQQSGPRPALVRITATHFITELFIAPKVGGFLQDNPDIDLELVADNRNLSLARRETDLALRLGRPGSGELRTRRLSTISYACYAATDAPDGNFYGYDDGSQLLPEAQWAQQNLPLRRRLRTNSLVAQARAATTGRGVALLPRCVAAQWPELREVSFAGSLPKRELWLVMREDIDRHPRARAVADFLIAELAGLEV